MEQLLAYMRLSFPNHIAQQAILGITKAKERLSQSRVSLGLAYPLLNNQLAMGLWGYYTPAMARADLVDLDKRQLTEEGQNIANNLTKQLGKAWLDFCNICDQAVFETNRTSGLAENLESVLYDPLNRTEFVESLIASNKECAAQSSLFQASKKYLDSGSKGEAKLFLDYLTKSDDDQLKNNAKHIQSVEPVLVVNNCVFTWLQGQHDLPLRDVHEKLSKRMNITGLSIPELSLPHQSFLNQTAGLINQKDTESYIEKLLQHHKEIMNHRNGSPWVEIQNGKVFVRVVSDTVKLPDEENGFNGIKDRFENSYFLNSFLSIAKESISKKEVTE